MSWLRLDVRSALAIAGVLAVVAGLTRTRRQHRVAAWCGAAALEVSIVAGLFALWQLANRIAHTSVAGGLDHGRWVWRLERTLHVPSETWLQGLLLHRSSLVRAANYYYATAHLTGMVIFLVWLWLRHRDRYPHWRNVVAVFTGIALFIEMIPVAPPRLIGGTGLIDTAMIYGQSVYDFVGSGVADQYAAVPSIHVGWALLIGIAMWRCGGRVAALVGSTHAVLTVFVVVATANHYWFDGFTAATVLAVAVAVVALTSRVVGAVRAAVPAASARGSAGRGAGSGGGIGGGDSGSSAEAPESGLPVVVAPPAASV